MEILSRMSAAAGVVLLLAGALWFLRRRGWAGWRARGTARGRRLCPVERLALGPHHSLHLVRLDGRALLVACSPAGCTLLESRPWSESREAGR